MNKVNLFIVGAQKCGTTAFAQYLKGHTDVSVMQIKESQLFSKMLDKNPNFNIDAFHEKEFQKNARIMVDASTTYSFYGMSERTAERIKKYNPLAKIIYIVKDPVDRIVSHYTHLLLRGTNMEPIDKAVFDNKLLRNSFYFSCIKPYTDIFESSQILIVPFKEIVVQNPDVMSRISSFINLDLNGLGHLPNANRGVDNTVISYKYRMYKKWFFRFFPGRVQSFVKHRFFENKLHEKQVIEPETRQKLKEILLPEMQKFYKLTEIDYR